MYEIFKISVTMGLLLSGNFKGPRANNLVVLGYRGPVKF
jgi:hypothetical protein